MNLFESIAGGLSAIRTHTLRSALTLVGIVVGVASVVAMFSLVSGVKTRVLEDFARVGFDNVFFIANMRAHNPDRLARLNASEGLTFEDTEVLRRDVPEIQYLCPTTESELIVRAGSEARRSTVFGITPDGFPLLRFEKGAGREVTWGDVDAHAHVCVLGEIIKGKLFAGKEAVGETVLLGDEKFTVVGVLRMKEFSPMFGRSGQEEYHEKIYVPITTAMHYMTGSRRLDYFALRLRDGTDISAAYEKIRGILLREHRQIEDFQIENVAQNIAEAIAGVNRVTRTWSMILGSIATVSLLVGGIGLFSVLLISVNERIREIGIRKAVGAENRAVFQQFLVESVTISAVGGLMGLLLGAGICSLITLIASREGQQFTIPVSGTGASLGIGFSLGVGVLFGWYPAHKASRLDPIEAITRPV
jgi:ABC-type antimicrobial peptide transport system permease subunit